MLILDALVVLVSILGLLIQDVNPKAQLYITLQETLLLAIGQIALKAWEIKHQGTIFASIRPSASKYSKSVNVRPKLKLQMLQLKK